ncbi:MAG: CHAP domain-containing protein [Candidatus Dormibacteraceae bacterium]
MWKAAVGLALVALLAIPAFLLMAILGGVQQVLGGLSINPQLAVVADAWDAAETCPVSGSAATSTVILVASAYAINGRGLTLGRYRNPWGSEEFVPQRYRAQAKADLRQGGPVDSELGLGGSTSPADWTTILPFRQTGPGWVPDPSGRHGFGFLLMEPAQWAAGAKLVPGGGAGLDPFSPLDALKVFACHLRHVEQEAGAQISRLTRATVIGPLLTVGATLFQIASAIAGSIPAIWARIQAEAHGNVVQKAWHLVEGGITLAWNAARTVLGNQYGTLGPEFLADVEGAMTPTVNLTASGVLYAPSAFARQDIPPAYLALFQRWAAQYGIDWTVLAGVGRIETDFGRSSLPGVSSGTNWAGAAGPMQFEAATFARYQVPASGSPPNLYDPGQAIAAAANYLASMGMTDPTQEQADLCHYNAGYGTAYQACMGDPNSYAAQVLGWAQRYRGAATSTAGAVAGALPWPVIPITDAVGTRTAIPPIDWPAGAAGHADPSAVSNQCVAGALWTWGVMHMADPRWSPPPPLAQAYAWEEYGAAQGEGFQTTGPDQPVVGSMVVYASGWGGSYAGHIATVIAVGGGSFEVVEQNVVSVDAYSVPAWNVFDVRIDEAGSPGIEGFIVAPP